MRCDSERDDLGTGRDGVRCDGAWDATSPCRRSWITAGCRCHRARRKREMEDAEKILAEFKRREVLVDAELEEDRKSQAEALEEKLAARRARREKRRGEING